MIYFFRLDFSFPWFLIFSREHLARVVKQVKEQVAIMNHLEHFFLLFLGPFVFPHHHVLSSFGSGEIGGYSGVCFSNSSFSCFLNGFILPEQTPLLLVNAQKAPTDHSFFVVPRKQIETEGSA